MKRYLFLFGFAAAVSMTGCTYALRTYNTPSEQQIRLAASAPQQYVIRVMAEQPVDYPVADDGRVSFHVPRLPRSCDWRLFGLVKIRDGSPEGLPAIHVVRGERTIRLLSLRQLQKLPVDEQGYHVLSL